MALPERRAAAPRLKPGDFDTVRRFLKERSGIELDDHRQYLVESRLGAVVRRDGLKDIAELVGQLRGRNPEVERTVVDAMTTNETMFFRDLHPFEALRLTILPELLERNRALRIWCGACSTGQEPYSLTMMMDQHFSQALTPGRLSITASDICTEVLDKARQGLYAQIEVNRGLPAALLMQYFKRQGRHWQFAERLRRHVQFRQANLLGPAPGSGFSIVMLRNVLIYFTEETRRTVLSHVTRAIEPGGYLFLGGAETLIGMNDGFEAIRIGRTLCYRKTR
jgi:chemotaxis protein methyltransferase CheR